MYDICGYDDISDDELLPHRSLVSMRRVVCLFKYLPRQYERIQVTCFLTNISLVVFARFELNCVSHSSAEIFVVISTNCALHADQSYAKINLNDTRLHLLRFIFFSSLWTRCII